MSGLLSQKFGFLVKLLRARLDYENLRSANIAELTGFTEDQPCFYSTAPFGTRVEQSRGRTFRRINPPELKRESMRYVLICCTFWLLLALTILRASRPQILMEDSLQAITNVPMERTIAGQDGYSVTYG
jgi:hypothetical protein